MYLDLSAGECQLNGAACTSFPARPSERTTAKKIRTSSPTTRALSRALLVIVACSLPCLLGKSDACTERQFGFAPDFHGFRRFSPCQRLAARIGIGTLSPTGDADPFRQSSGLGEIRERDTLRFMDQPRPCAPSGPEGHHHRRVQ